MMDFEKVAKALGLGGKQQRPRQPRTRVIGDGTVLHYKHPRICRVRKLVRNSKEILQKESMKGTQVKEVAVRHIEVIDRNKYTAKIQRDLRAERGCGKRRVAYGA